MMPYRRRSSSGGLTAAIILIGLFLSFAFGGFNPIIFFIFLAIAIFVGSLATFNPRKIYGALIGATWMIILALFFTTHFWPLFLIGTAITILLGILARTILASLLGLGLFSWLNNQQPQMPYYQPSQSATNPLHYQPSQSPYQPYEQGYQAASPPDAAYQETGTQYPYSSQGAQDYEQPQAQYPLQMPPQP